MNDCGKYQDLISAYIDGEITSEERAELMAHIEVCPECAELLKIYTEISLIASEDVEPPEALLTNVMAEVHRINAEKAAPKKKAKVIYFRWAAMAACAALAIFVGTKFAPTKSFDTAMTATGGAMAPDTELYAANSAVSYSRSAEENGTNTVIAKSEAAEDDVVAYDAALDTVETAEPEAAPEPSSRSDADGGFPAADNALTGAPTEVPDSAGGAIVVETCASAEDIAMSTGSFAVLKISAEDFAAIGTLEELSYDGKIWSVCDGYEAILISEDTFNTLSENELVTVTMLKSSGNTTAVLAVMP